MHMRIWGGVALAALLSACSGGVVPHSVEPGYTPPAREVPRSVPRETGSVAEPHSNPAARQPIPATPLPAIPAAAAPAGTATAKAAGLIAGPAFDSLPLGDDAAARALVAFRLSCPSLVRRTDTSGLTQGADWQPACDAARSWPERDARGFFGRWFETVQVADGKAQATGYYEPEIAGSRHRRPGYDVPVYAKPDDIIEVDLGQFSTDLKGKKIRGRVAGKMFVPYFDRKEIDGGALNGRGLEIAYAADPVELFFLQIQGSGRLRGPDGQVMRIGFAGQNGREYVGIGALMRDRGLLQPGKASMQGIMEYLRSHPEEGQAIMWENKSYVFFQELKGAGPNGSLGLPVTGQASAAVDPKFIPLGAPVFLSMDRAEANGLWIAQDTGGAIKGPNRVDTFWGAGDDARAIAGGMNARGTAWLLLPVGTLSKLGGAPIAGVPAPQRQR
ncbi:murein transglycosylase A [Sphingomonas sp. HITSZ_GF]|uniref:murein transglycosylase A n=1 Tax=Sphingomonas sp. HITSZ_GF TaxID=3037247 RepID=UPI00240E10BA|nr:murein transglycosylase A [Sphingomonas sp. HITSZ_GF]MDG2532022.1 murein transglycosylase A [Sphingomonas sp. HITSZ_GF]